jgi:hypothetical protein
MQIVTFIKRTIQVLVLLGTGGGLLLWATYSYIDSSPAAQARLKISVEDVEDRIDQDAGVMTKATALFASWWASDDLLAEKARDAKLEKQVDAERKAEAESQRFNDNQTGYDEDYYPGGN